MAHERVIAMGYKFMLKKIISLSILVSTCVTSMPILASTSYYFYAPNLLKWGSRSEQVKQLQGMLKQLGYFKSEVTGFFGSVTTNAVKQFQIKSGLPSDGIVGPKTWEMLFKAIRNFNPEGLSKPPKGEGNKKSPLEHKKEEQIKQEPTKQEPTKQEPIIKEKKLSEAVDIPQSTCGFSKNEITMLEKIAYAEARGEGHDGMVAVVAVLLNRVKTEGFPNTISGVIYESRAFESISNGEYYRSIPNEGTRKAVMAAINGCDPTNGCTYFYNPAGVKPGSWVWNNVTIEKKMGKHSFGRKKK